MSDIKNKTIFALIWNGLDKFGANIIYLILGIVLARLLSPNDYGVMGILSIFTVFAGTIIDSGLGIALIRKKEVTEEDYNSIFYFNLIVCLLLYILLWMVAPSIAYFFNKQELTVLARVGFTVLLVNALGSIQQTKLTKEIDFKNKTIANMLSLFVGGVFGIAAAFNDFGVWSLIIQMISGAIVKTIFVWYISDWRPKLLFSLQSIKEMLSFSLSILGASIVNLIYLNSYSFIIGRLFSLSALGYYSQGTKWSDMFVNSLGGIFQSSTLTVFSAIQDNKDQLIRSYRKMMRLAAFITFPLLLGLAFFARPIVMVMLSTKWEQSIIYIQLLSSIGIVTVFSVLNQNFATIAGKSALLFRIEIWKLFFSFVAIAITYRYGILMIVYGLAATRLFVYVATTWIVGRIVDYRLNLQIKDIVPYFGISLIAGFFSLLTVHFFDNYLVQMLLGGTLFIIIYIAIVRISGSKIFSDLFEFLTSNKRD
ncbi:MAG: lipopolysaccharide biosynthesis protein [Bacteroidales bacterium]|nr:lipopolysaccharide biosynthesis protein [Bacteroidales bacterium]